VRSAMAPGSSQAVIRLGGGSGRSVETKAPRAGWLTIQPSATSSSKAATTVSRCTPSARASVRVPGNRSPGCKRRRLMSFVTACDRAAPDISCGKHARKTCLEEKRRPSLCAPEIAAHRVERDAAAGQHETLLIKLHAAAQPFGVRIGADEEEERRRLDPRLGA